MMVQIYFDEMRNKNDFSKMSFLLSRKHNLAGKPICKLKKKI